jgi:murein DD-endopeptidase MepM/ murein hydrolase activator NlpD
MGQVWEERKALIAEYGVLPQQCGNHVVIRHDGGEHSFYGHMMYQSLTVTEGSHVKQGQVIGKIGNTGLSGCPHLHFQLMNGPDFLTSRGLPCHFTNIRNLDGSKLAFIQEEYTIVHTE